MNYNDFENALKRINLLNVKEINVNYINNCYIIDINFISGNKCVKEIKELNYMTHTELVARKSRTSIFNKLNN